MITLRKNQTEPISKATAFFKEKRPAPSLIVLPTAWGKSILTAFVAKDMEDKLLVLQPSKELLEQNYKKYVSMCGDFGAQAGVYSASFGRKDINKITYATIGSIKKIGKTFKQLGFKKMLIDEAHLYPREADSMLGQFLEDSEISHVLGITATPIKLQANTGLNGERFSKLVMLTSRSKKGNFFKDIVHVSQVQEMIELGFWSKLEYKTSGFDSSQLVYNSSKSEFTEDSMQRAFAANDIHNQIKQELDVNSDRKHILAFVPSIEEAIQFAQEYPNSAAIYSGMHDSERERVISEFRKGNIRVIFNVRVLSTGFDYTKIDCIILGISTASIALYYQICVDLETEILTQRGFLRHNEMSYNDKAAAFEPETGKIVWADIENITHRKVHPSEKFVSYKNPHLDFKVTDEHDLLVRGKGRSDNKNYKPYRKMKAIDVPNMTQGIYMPVSGIMESDGAPLTDYEVRFIGYLLSDGNLNKTNNAIAITQSLRYPEVIADIEDVLNGCGFKYGKILRKRKGEESKYLDVYHFTVSKGMPRGTDTDKRGWANLGKYIGGCKTWLDAYEEFNERQFDLLLESINKADGAKNEHADYNVKSYTIAMGINREYADKFQSLAVRRGYRCNMYTSKQNENKQYIMHLKKQTYSTIAGSKMKDEYLHGKMQHREHIAVSSSCNDDEVWCIKNSVGTIITRRNGKVLIMGNCGRGTRIDDEKENCLISDLAGNVDRFGKVEDITFEKERIWKMYGTGGRLLSGIPIHEIGTIKKGDVEKEVPKNNSNIGKPLETMPFGKYKGESFKDIPKEYREWMLKSFDWHAANMNLKQAIEGSL